jgi:hypothetical protein
MIRTWLIVGSSPSATDYFNMAQERYYYAMTFAANSAIKLFTKKRPDYFIAVDETAGIMLKKYIVDAIDKGTNFVTYKKSMLLENLKGNISLPGFKVDLPEPRILLDVGKEVTTSYRRGKVVNAQYSGLAAMQYALKRGAERLVLVGCDGYPGGRPLEDWPVVTFDGHTGDSWGDRQTFTVIEPFMRSMIERCPNVEFIQYGKPLYTVDAPNYTKCTLAQEMNTCT